MRILVCVKQVPEAERPGGTGPGSDRRAMNLADRAALEAALSLRSAYGGSAEAVCMGPPAAGEMLRELFQYGIDRAYLVSDPVFAGSDTLATARVLARAEKHLGGFDLILTGRRASDGETGHTGPEIAALLGYRCVTDAIALRSGGAGLICERLLEDKRVTLSVPLPAVVTVSGGYLLRPPSIAGMRAAREKRAELLTAEVLGIAPGEAGKSGSATEVRRVWPAERPERHCRLYRDAEEGACAVLELLKNGPPQVRQTEAPAPSPPEGGKAAVVSLMSDGLSCRCAPELASAARNLCAGVAHVLLDDAGGDDVSAAGALCDYISAEKPDCVLFPATVRGRAVAPLCAALLGAGLTADCTALGRDAEGGVRMIRPTFGGTLMAEVTSRTKPVMASVRPGVIGADGDMPETLRLHVPPGEVKVLSESGADVPALSLGKKVIVSAGRGAGRKENVKKLEAMAGALGGVLAGSRAAVDGGLLPYPRQVGQTGATVRPDCYIACGISGSVQHMAGVRAAAIVAVNTDPKAPIFDYADIGIIADCMAFADILAEKLSQSKK